MFYEIVVAPGYTPEGLEVLKGKSKALRILEAKPRPPSGRSLRQVAGGWLLQVTHEVIATWTRILLQLIIGNLLGRLLWVRLKCRHMQDMCAQHGCS